MKEFREYIKIAKLITSKTFENISNENTKKLQNWENSSSENKSIVNKLLNLEGYNKWVETYYLFDAEKNWEKTKRRIHPKTSTRKLRYQLIKIAAALFIPIAIFFAIQQNKNLQTKDQFINIAPGYPKAFLTLNDGQIIGLDNRDTTFNIENVNVTIKNHLISYQGTNPKKSLGNNTLTTPVGGEYSLMLSDGTKIKLNAATKLEYPVAFSGKKREVKLNGEAFLKVFSNPSKPFKVETGKIGVEVLGTAFNVKAYESEETTKTTLNEGKVKVNSWNKEIIIKPNQQITFYKSTNRMIVEDVDASIFSAWTKGRLVFKDVRLEEIMQSLTKWYNFNIIYESEEVKDLCFSINVNRYDNINNIFEFLATTQTLKYEVKNNVAIIKRTE